MGKTCGTCKHGEMLTVSMQDITGQPTNKIEETGFVECGYPLEHMPASFARSTLVERFDVEHDCEFWSEGDQTPNAVA